MPEIKPVEDQVNIPEIEVKLPPEIEAIEPSKPAEVNLTAEVLKWRDRTKAEIALKYHSDPMAWLIIPVLFFIVEWTSFGMQVVTTIIDSLFNALLSAAYDIYVAWVNFINTVKEHYHGNWGQAIIDLTLRILLLEALDEAMNIPAVKQTVDLIISTVQQVRSAFSNLRNQLNIAFSDTFHAISQAFTDNNDYLQYILGQEFQFWTNSITTFVNSIQSSLTKAINNLETRVFSDIYKIADELQKLKDAVEKYDKEFKDKAVSTVNDAIKKLTEIHYIELGPAEVYQWLRSKWQELKEKTTEYLNRIYQLFEEHTTIDTFDLSALYREMKEELFTVDSDMDRYIDKLVSEIEELDNWLEEGNTVKVVIKSDTIEEVREKKQ